MNTNSFFPSNDNFRSLSSNDHLKTYRDSGFEQSGTKELKQRYQSELNVNIREGESQGRQIFSKSIEFSLGIKTEANYEFKIPSPKDVAATVLGFVEKRINMEKNSGASNERLNDLLTQARSGIEKGYAQAEKEIKDLGLMNEELAADISEGRSLIDRGLDNIDKGINTLVSPEPASSKAPSQVRQPNEDSAQALKSNEELFSVAKQDLSSKNVNEISNGISAVKESITQLNQNSADFVLQTQEGDQILIRFSDLKSSSYSRDAQGESLSVNQSSRFEFSVNGDLSQDELEAINDLLVQVDKVSSLFFDDQFEDAFNSALNLGFDSEQIASFSLDLAQLQVQEVRTYQDGSKSALDAYRRNQPLINMAQQFERLDSLMQPFERFEKVNSMIEALVSKAIERYSVENRADVSSSTDNGAASSSASSGNIIEGYVSFARKILENISLLPE